MTSSKAALGVASLWVTFKRLGRSPKLWPYALLPCCLLFGTMTLLLVYGASPLVTLAVERTGVANLDTWYGAASVLALLGVLWATSGLAAIWTAMVVTPPLCAPALEYLVRAEEEVLGAPPRLKLSIWFELLCGVRAQLIALGFTLCVWIALSTLALLAPLLVVITLPLKVLAVAAALAWSLLDYPLTLRGVGAKRRLMLFKRQPSAILGFGLPFAVLFWFPCSSVLLLPVGAMAATRVVWQLAQVDPEWRRALVDAQKT